MLICPLCEQAAVDGSCLCGSDARVQLNDKGVILALYGSHGFGCQRCEATDQDVALRLYKRVVGAFIIDRVYSTGGYFCKSCRRANFWRHMGLTLTLGWWGVFALVFRNPFAIITNIRALFGPPMVPQDFGGLPLRTIYPTGDEVEYQQAVVAGQIEDTWHCSACDRYIVGHEYALRHADKDHKELYLDEAKAALTLISQPPAFEIEERRAD